MAQTEIEIVDPEASDEALDTKPEDPQAKEFKYDEDEANLCKAFMAHPDGVAALKKIADQVIQDYDTAREASEEYRQRMSSDWKLFSGDLPKKEAPFQDSANVQVPILLENGMRLALRLEGEIFDDWSNVFGVVPLGPEDEEVAETLSAHGNWQLNEQITDFKRQASAMVLAFIVIGDVTVHSYWDEKRKQNRHEVLTPDDFVTPNVTTRMPDYGDLPYYVKRMKLFRNEIQARKDFWFETEKVIDKERPSFQEDDAPLAKAVSEAQGVSDEKSPRATPYEFLWYEGWLELPNQDRDRWCKVIIDQATKGILEFSILEQPNWQDKQRYDKQAADRDQYFEAKTAYQQFLEQQQQQIAAVQAQLAASAGDMGPAQSMMAQQGLAGAQEQMLAVQPPIPPDWMVDPEDPSEEPEPPRMEPIRLFTHFVAVEPLAGNLGFSYGRVLAEFNRASNTLSSQFVDTATLGNLPCYLANDVLEMPEKLTLSPGKITKVKVPHGQSLKDNLIPIGGQQANPQLAMMSDKQYEYAQNSVQAPSVLSGDPGKSGETYRGIAARIEQATKQLSVFGRKFTDSFKQVLRNNAKLNEVYLPDDELIQVASHELAGSMTTIQVGRRLYERNYSVKMTTDMRFTTQAERVQEAQGMLQLPGQVPPLQANLGFWYQAVVGLLKAVKRQDMIAALGKAPPPTPEFGMPPMMPPGPPGAPPQGGGAPPQGPPQGAPPHGGPQG